jgi:uncharacterized membrane protein
MVSPVFQAISSYEIPLWHPMLVHFPIGVLAAGSLAVGIWLFVGSSFWRNCAAFLYGLGAVAAAAAYWTGEEAYEQSKDVPIVDELAHLHADYATYTLVLSVVTAGALLAAIVWNDTRRLRIGARGRDPVWLRLVIGLLAVLTAGSTAYTAHLGGLMVWGV